MSSSLESPLQAIVASTIARRAAGESVDDAAIIAAHPDLMPQLGRELAAISQMQRAAAHAVSAAADSDEIPIEPLSQDELDQPIEWDEAEPEAEDDGAADGEPNTATRAMTLQVRGYRLLEEVSVGGQATVYKAVSESTGGLVAIKVLFGGPFLNRRARSRFEREAKSLAALNHPNIAKILDRGRTPDGSFFLVMNFIDGVALDDWVVAGVADPDPASPRPAVVPSLDAVLKVVVTIADAVRAAHEQGIVHRDLKPSNIIVDRKGEPHVLDFGLARPLHTRDTNPDIDRPDYTVTVTGNVIGSLRWSSPEQASGGSRDVGQSSDVYSLGVVLYELLAGVPPYHTAGSIVETIQNIRSAYPRAFAEVPNCRFRGISEVLQAVVFKALEKNPRRRYASAGELAADLRRYLAGERVEAKLVKRGLRRPWPRLVVAAAVVLIGAGAYLWDAYRDKPPVVVDLPHWKNSVGMEFVRVPKGSGVFGSHRSDPARSPNEPRENIKMPRPFDIATTEVTIGQYRQIMGTAPVAGPDNLPVTNVTWKDAADFCRRLSRMEGKTYRLPTEFEWEYASRAATTTPYSGTARLEQMGWFKDNAGGKLHPVAQKFSNRWGLYDMHGNAAEWCADEWAEVAANRTQPPADAGMDAFPAPDVAAVTRGGSYGDPAEECRSASRWHKKPGAPLSGVGFRVLCASSEPVASTQPATDR